LAHATGVWWAGRAAVPEAYRYLVCHSYVNSRGVQYSCTPLVLWRGVALDPPIIPEAYRYLYATAMASSHGVQFVVRLWYFLPVGTLVPPVLLVAYRMGNRELVEHALNVDPKARPVKQPLR
jgi:hypothetical protein